MALSGMAVAGNTMVGDVLWEESISHSKRRRMPESDKLKICIFSKHLQRLNYNDMASLAAEIGFEGIDRTVRPRGHILPERVYEDCPELSRRWEK